MPYTKKEKEELIQFIKDKTEEKIADLEDKKQSIEETSQKKLLRRLNSVSATLWDVKLKDVLELERRQKLTLRNLLQDIKDHNENFRIRSAEDSRIKDVSLNSFRASTPANRTKDRVTKITRKL